VKFIITVRKHGNPIFKTQPDTWMFSGLRELYLQLSEAYSGDEYEIVIDEIETILHRVSINKLFDANNADKRLHDDKINQGRTGADRQ
jgi:hypothetical protein